MVVMSILSAATSSLICDGACAFDSSMNMISMKEILRVRTDSENKPPLKERIQSDMRRIDETDGKRLRTH